MKISESRISDTRYIGKVCEKHPHLNGERLITQRKCTSCHNEKVKSRHKSKRSLDLDYRTRNNAYFAEYAKVKRLDDPEYRRRKINNVNKRHILKLHRIPPWANLKKIDEIYEKAWVKCLTVDHIIPLQGELVSGLHVENNLQYLTSEDNSRKGNKFDPNTFVGP